MHSIQLISFGYLHLPPGPDGTPIPPAADRAEDMRDPGSGTRPPPGTSSTSTASTPACRTSS